MTSAGRYGFIIVVSLIVICIFITSFHNPYVFHGSIRHSNENTSLRRLQATGYDVIKSKSISVAQPLNQATKKNMTSAERSIFNIQNRINITAGDVVIVLLEARDANGIRQKTGGDFWVATLHSNGFKYSTTGKIIDNNNGTYTVYFYAGIGGRLNINITMVHPVEAITWLKNVYVPNEDCFSWDGHFIARNTTTIIQECTLRHIFGGRDQFDKIKYCYYGYGSKGIGHAALVCDRPADDRIPCDSLEYLAAHGGSKALDAPVDILLAGNEYLFQKPNYMEEMLPKEIVIRQRSSNDMSSNNALSENLLEASSKQNRKALRISSNKSADAEKHIREISPEGYWLENKWHSLKYNVARWSPDEISRCLADCHVVMLGDSTMNQWIDALDTRIKPWKSKTKGIFLQLRSGSTFNLTFHRNRLNKVLSGLSPFKGPMEYFEPELIDRLPRGNCQYLIVIGLAAHYGSWPLTDYKDRLVTLKRAVLNLRSECGRSGHVDVVIKMAHARDHPSFEARVHSNNWVFFTMNSIMRDVFGGMNAKFVSVWDMVISYPSALEMHMPMECIQNELDLFFSQVCPP